MWLRPQAVALGKREPLGSTVQESPGMEPQGVSLWGMLDRGLPPPPCTSSVALTCCYLAHCQEIRQLRTLHKHTSIPQCYEYTNSLQFLQGEKQTAPPKMQGCAFPSAEVNEIICSHFPIIASNTCCVSSVPSPWNSLGASASSRTFSQLSPQVLGTVPTPKVLGHQPPSNKENIENIYVINIQYKPNM